VRLFTDTASSAKADRPGVEEAVSFAHIGDTLVVWQPDHLGRSLPHRGETVTGLQDRSRLAWRSDETLVRRGSDVHGLSNRP
jgi:DNA invertase Pin-like site-specific DNA recombinase